MPLEVMSRAVNDLSFPNLERLLGRTKIRPRYPLGFYELVAELFGMPGDQGISGDQEEAAREKSLVPERSPAQKESMSKRWLATNAAATNAPTRMPVAAICASADGIDTTHGWWLRLDPIHLHADLTDLIALPVEMELMEAERLGSALKQHFPDLDLHLTNALRWYLQLRRPAQISTYAIGQVMGRGVSKFLPRGPDASGWNAWLNEAQMVLHGNKVNESRRDRGENIVNGLWLWGGGSRPRLSAWGESGRWGTVWTEDDYVRGLAKLRDIPIRSLSFDDEIQVATSNQLVVCHALLEPAERQDLQHWCLELQRLDKQWMQPLLSLLEQGKIPKVKVVTESAEFIVQASFLRRWWRRSSSVGALLRAARTS